MTKEFERHERSSEMDLIKKDWAPLEYGTRWVCLRCSWCCKRPWAVNLTWWEYERLSNDPRAAILNIDKVEVDQGTGLTHPYFVIKDKCPMLKEDGAVCTLYPDWPYTCATYPFLLMPDGTIQCHSKCAGFGHGDIVNAAEMRAKILRERKKAGIIVESE